MSNLILVHGAWHGAWCWNKLIPLLEQSGHNVIAPDLPGHSQTENRETLVELDDYIFFVKELIEQQSEQVCLLGHSMAGIIISSVAEVIPDNISRLIYLSGFLLTDGQSLLEITKEDKQGIVLPNLVYSRERKSAKVKDTILQEAFYHDCCDEDVNFARPRLVSQSLAPFDTPIHVTHRNWGRVPRSYIECTEDRAVTIMSQRLMVQRNPCEKLYSIQSGHSPFLSKPEQLAEYIDLICK